MSFIVRLLLVVAGALAALFVARDALGFPVVTGVIAILLVAVAVIALAFVRRR